MEFSADFWDKPDSWLAVIKLNKEGCQTYGKIKKGYALLERLPETETEYHFLDIVIVKELSEKQRYRDDEIKVYQATEIVQKSNLKTFSFEIRLPSTKEYFHLQEWFAQNKQGSEIEFPYKAKDKKWLKGRCSANDLHQAEQMLKRFIKKENGGLVAGIIRRLSNKSIDIQFRNLKS